MAKFHYKARSKETHKLFTGTIEAKDRQEAAKKLRAKDFLILSIGNKTAPSLSLGFLNQVSSKDRILFARELAVMIKAGLPIIQALKAIRDQTANPTLKKTIGGLVTEIQGGTALSAAFKHYPAIFPAIFVSVSQVGEKSGKLEEVLEKLANQLEKDDDLVSKIKGAMIYPTFVLGALVAVIILILVFIIPQLSTLFEDVDIEVPLITQILISTSDFVSNYILLLLGLAFLVLIGLKIAMRNMKIRYFFERLRFRLPVFGKLYRKILMTRFTNTLATLLAAGLPMVEAMKTTGAVMDSPTYTRSISTITHAVESGESLSHSLLIDKEFPSMIGNMVAIGEDTGNIDTVLETVGTFYEKEVENLTRNLSALIEPILMAVMGIGIGFVIASVMVPIYNIANSV